VTSEQVRGWIAAGINRVSLGVQSFDAGVLEWMHRSHEVADVQRAAAVLRDEGIDNWSLDLIYALPAEVARDWRRDLDAAVALAPTHISAYGLTVETGTPLARWAARGAVHEADEDRYAEDFLLAHALLERAGFTHYEVSNFATAGRIARHNSSYWRGVPYLGLGPGAHGFSGRVRRWNEREYVRWRERVGASTDPLGGAEELSAEQLALERVYVELRTTQGVVPQEGDDEVLARWTEAGWGSMIDGRYRLTPLGWLRLDALVTALTEHRSR
jgi:oxygen-independent coproporphyrinogen-3 oxidase